MKLVFWTIILAAFGGSVAYIYLYHEVRKQFSGKLWEIPVHIYSNSFELYPNVQLAADRLEHRLQGLGYRKRTVAQNPGEYSVQEGAFNLVTRPFTFWDGHQKSKTVRLEIKKERLASMADSSSGQPINSLRLRPHLIGSLSQLTHEDRELLRIQEIPKLFLSTLIAVEDRNFASHYGVDFRGILRAAWANLKANRIVQGGSTLTQQLVKNVSEREERSYQRKLLEIATAFVLEQRLEKHEILEAYCNEVYLGQDGKRAIHGFGLGSHYFFGRPLAELDASEMALLVGMVKAPSSYHPLRNPERALKRRNVVLSVMREQNLLSEDEYLHAVRAPLNTISVEQRKSRNYGSYVDVVLRQISKYLNEQEIANGNFAVYTYMDIEVQKAAERALSTEIEALEKRQKMQPGTLQGAIVVVQPDTGQLIALVGGRRGYIGMFNRALDAHRPIGSLIKPFVYLTAFAKGSEYTLATLLVDEPVTIPTKNKGERWQPQNFDEDYLGNLTALEAISRSRNIPTVRLGLKVGLKQVANQLNRFGIQTRTPLYPSLLLGISELSPLRVTQYYQILANFGYRVGLRAISTIGRSAGIAEKPPPMQADSVISSEYAQLILFALQEVVKNGTGKSLSNTFSSDLKLAGKTGTTDDFRDSWYVGMAGNLLAVVWLGRDDNQPTGLTGASGALKVWASMMNQLDLRPFQLNISSQLEFAQIDLDTGLIASQNCRNVKRIPFVRGTAPTSISNC